MNTDVSDKSDVKRGVTRWLIREVMGVLFAAALLFGISGHLDWVMGWILVGTYALWVGGVAVILIPRYPEMLAERVNRSAKGTKKWDTAILSVVGVLELVRYVVAGLDMRWGWSPPFPLALQIAGVVVAVLAQDVLLTWSMASNAFFSMVVRIQDDRDHAVASGGPYRFVRHPGYVASVLFYLATSLMLGSVWAAIPALLTALLFVVRTALEDRTLREELDGYEAYARRVRYRLLPGVW